ncbi:MAG: hypothetical protein GF317_10530 [Candidatus Lokiarchaeota archaeon]|nr:hypothetical protein [Candidatus Lokiarchaeota archaeon]MBD3200096.1 hypothetical protein [Candidatus Lokiarchaeota archaeon]
MEQSSFLKERETCYFKKKVSLLGCNEPIKNEFQDIVSSCSLPLENKSNIGVNISRVHFDYNSNNRFDYFLWNIDCSQSRSFLRTTFYNGAEAIIVFISEDNLEHILRYFEEIRNRIPIVFIQFCIILNNKSKSELLDNELNGSQFQEFIQSNEVEFNELQNATDTFSQISNFFIEKVRQDKFESKFNISFIARKKIIGENEIDDRCSEYFPPSMSLVNSKIIQYERIKNLVKNLGINVDQANPDWIVIENENFGRFSVYLRNGSVYYTPYECENCSNTNCPNYHKKKHYICIEAESTGWSNVRGIREEELLILSKIIALKDATEKSLPKSILEQIHHIQDCAKLKN